MKNKKVIITYGTYDMFHIGHMNLLKRAKALGDYLIVGVTDENYDRSRGKLNVSENTKKRINAIKALDFVDKVILETHKGQKAEDMQKYGVDVFAIGDDWIGAFDYLNKYTHVEYLPRTKGISSTELREEQFEPIKLGIVGLSKDTEKFIEEASFVVNIKMNRIYSDEIKKIKKFTKNNKIKYGHNNYDEFLDTSINAVFINSSESNTYSKIKKALKAGKHVLCDNPISIEKDKFKKLKRLAKQQQKILLVELKTAFLPVFSEYKHDLEGCGFRYMIAEFGSLVQRGKRKSKILQKYNKKNRKK